MCLLSLNQIFYFFQVDDVMGDVLMGSAYEKQTALRNTFNYCELIKAVKFKYRSSQMNACFKDYWAQCL